MQAFKALPPDNRALSEQRLVSPEELIAQSRCDRTKQDDDYLKEMFPQYELAPHV